jgi:hypothetical protein
VSQFGKIGIDKGRLYAFYPDQWASPKVGPAARRQQAFMLMSSPQD